MSNDFIAGEDLQTDEFCDGRNLLIDFPSPNSTSHGSDPHESSNLVLDYINQILMEENEDNYTLLSIPDIEAAEKPFYELIGENYLPSPDRPFICPILSTEHSDGNSSQNPTCSGIYNFYSNSVDAKCQSSFSLQSYLPSFSGNVGFDELGFRDYQFSEMLVRTIPATQLEKGAEEVMKFLPGEDKVVISVGEFGTALPREPVAKFVDYNKRQKNQTDRDPNLEEQRRSKQRTISYDELAVTEEMFDVLLLSADDDLSVVVNSIREKMDSIEKKNYKIAERREIGGSQNSRSKKQPTEATVNLHTLLLHCSQSVANGEIRRAYEQLRQIRQHSSHQGDASQRVAHYIANGLEARLSGTGNEACYSVPRWKTVADVLKAYELHLGYCPFKKITYHFANQIILDAIQDSQSVHILDFGICYGLQWPIFIKKLGLRPGGPPSLRISGIDFPQPGFRPSERIEETVRLLARYAERFGVPFEYHAIAAKFDDLKEEQLHLHENETLVVNSMFCLHYLADETVGVDCPRDMVLQSIRKLKPSVFVNAIVNGTYGAPFFVTRFREALYHFSALFDMLDSTTSRENERRLLVERDLYGNFLINVISCEGFDRERPETYKQWQVRCLRAGFEQLPIRKCYIQKVEEGMRSYYHKDFNIEEHGRWLLQGWKGRILYGLSAWKTRC